MGYFKFGGSSHAIIFDNKASNLRFNDSIYERKLNKNTRLYESVLQKVRSPLAWVSWGNDLNTTFFAIIYLYGLPLPTKAGFSPTINKSRITKFWFRITNISIFMDLWATLCKYFRFLAFNYLNKSEMEKDAKTALKPKVRISSLNWTKSLQ